MTITRRRALRVGAVTLGGSLSLASTGTQTGMAASVEPAEERVAIKAAGGALSELQVSSLDLSLDWKGIDDPSELVAFELGVRVDGGERQRLAEGDINLGGESPGGGPITESGDAPTWDVTPWDDDSNGTIGLLSGTFSVGETFTSGGSYDLEFDVRFEHTGDDVTASDTTTITLNVLHALDAVASVTPEVGAFDEVYTFDASGTVGPAGHDLTYEWDFGNGTTTTGVTATHSFGTVGTHAVTLTVYDEDGDSDTAECEVVIENPAPTAVASADVQTVYAGNEVAFDATESSDPLGESLTYEWDFDGDGVVDATGAAATHTYESAGGYTATLTVTDSGGNSATDTVSITVESLPDSATFQYTGGPEVYDVSEVSTVRIEMNGAGGQSGERAQGSGGAGGVGGYIEGVFDVSEFDELYVYVGGGNGTTWGYYNGGEGGKGGDFHVDAGRGGNGGGSTEIYGDDETFLATANAGGGGGGGFVDDPDISYDDYGGGGGGGGARGGSGGDGASAAEQNGFDGSGAEGSGAGGNGGHGGGEWHNNGNGDPGGDGGQSYNGTYAETIEQETRGGGNTGHGDVFVEPVA